MDKGELRSLLESVLTPDTSRVKSATAKLKKDYYRSPQALGLLFQIVVSDDTMEIRQLAATEARKLVPRHWPNIPSAQKPDIRNHLLQSTTSEESKAVRHSMSRLIGMIAQKDIADEEWKELPGLLLQGAESSSEKAREVSTYILFAILDELDDADAFDYGKMFHVFSKTLQDRSNPEIPVNTLFALSKMAIVIDVDGEEPAMASFQALIPSMVSVLKDVINSADSDRITQVFECFTTILEAKPKIFDSHFQQLVQEMATITADGSKDNEVRTQSLNFLMTCLLQRRLKFQGLRIGEDMVRLLFSILASADTGPGSLLDDEMDLTKTSMHMLSLMAGELSPQQVAAPIIKLFKEYAAAPEPRKKQAAITALAQCVEGAPEFVRSQLPKLLPQILRLLNDPSAGVRESAVLGCRDLAESLPEVLAEEHERFLTAFAKNLAAAIQRMDSEDDAKNQVLAANCCLAIDGLISGLEASDVEGYMSDLVPNLTSLFNHPSIDIKKASISAVGSIAIVSQKGFLPYFDQTAGALSHFIGLKEGEEKLDLRAIAIDTMGDLADAVGPDAFKSYVPGLIEASKEGLTIDHPRLKETSYMLWAALAKTYKDDFNVFLSDSVEAILDCLAQDEDADLEVDLEDTELIGQEVLIGGKKVKVVSNGMAEKDDEDEEDGDDDDDDWADLAGISAVAEEKEIALEALADIFSHTGKGYLPYYEKTIEAILPLLEHNYEGTRKQAIATMFRLYASLWQLQPESQAVWEPGLPVKSTPSPEIEKVRDLLMTSVLGQYPTEDDSLGETLKTCGPFLISGEGAIEQIVQVLVQVIKQKHPAQLGLDDSDEPDVDEENSEDEWFTIETALEGVAGLARVLGSQFAELWIIFEKSILAYASATSPAERAATVGALADIIRGMRDGSSQFTSSFLKILLHRLSDEDAQVKSNAAYAIGILVENSQKEQEIKKVLPTILSKLEPLLHTTEARQLDNAAGCVARMVTRYPAELPLGEILPALVDLLPLKEDYEENIAVWPMIVRLYREGNDTIQELTPKIVPALEEVLGEPEDQLNDKTRSEVHQLVQYLHSKQPSIIQQHPALAKVLQ